MYEGIMKIRVCTAVSIEDTICFSYSFFGEAKALKIHLGTLS